MRHPVDGSFVSTKVFLSRIPSSYTMRRLLTSVCLLALGISAGSAARADENDGSTTIRAVRISNVVGAVQVWSAPEIPPTQAYANMPLTQGSKVQTGEDGRVEIQFEDGSITRLTPNSSAELPVLKRNVDGNTSTEVDLLTGMSYVEMSGTANQKFVVHFAGNEVISPAPVKFRVSLDANPVVFAVLDGSAHLSKGDVYAVDVKIGESVRFDSNDDARYMLAQGVDPDSWDQWNADRDQALALMGAKETQEARLNGNPNDPAWRDLDYYGNWYTGGDGSQYWVPDGAGSAWDPYGLGYWGYAGGIGGYSWISGYPWGWYPYHCGNWSYLNSAAGYSNVGFAGWAWSPIGCGSRWYPAGVIGTAPPRYRMPRAPIGRLPVHGPVIVSVDRGLEATRLTPHGPAPRTVVVNGQPAPIIPKTVNAHNTLASRTLTAGPGRTTYSSPSGQPFSSVPVYRPTAPASGGGTAYHPSTPVPSGGTYRGTPSTFNPAGGGSPHFSAPASTASSSSGAHVSAPAPSGGSSGGGHVK